MLLGIENERIMCMLEDDKAMTRESEYDIVDKYARERSASLQARGIGEARGRHVATAEL